MKALDPRNSALLLIDVVNDFEFPASEALMREALPAAERLAAVGVSTGGFRFRGGGFGRRGGGGHRIILGGRERPTDDRSDCPL